MYLSHQLQLFFFLFSRIVISEADEEADEDENGEQRIEVGNESARKLPVGEDGEESMDKGDGREGVGAVDVTRESDEEDDDEVKQRLSASGVILPLGWPKVWAYVGVYGRYVLDHVWTQYQQKVQ